MGSIKQQEKTTRTQFLDSMKPVFLALVVALGLAMLASAAVGPAAADTNETEVSWEETPPESVEHGETITVAVDGSVADEGELTLEDESGLISSSIAEKEIDENWTGTTWELQVGEDIDAAPGDELELAVEVEEDGLFADSDTTTTSEMTVEEVEEWEIDWLDTPPAEVEAGDSFEFSFVGMAEESGEVCAEDDAGWFDGGHLVFSYEQCQSVDEGYFEVEYDVDATVDLELEPGATAKMQGSVGTDGFFGIGGEPEAGTWTEEVEIVEPTPDVDWETEPPETAAQDGSFEVTLSGVTPESSEVCVEEDAGLFGWISGYETCETVDAGYFEATFDIDAGDLDADAGETADLQGTVEEDSWFGDSDETDFEPIEIEG